MNVVSMLLLLAIGLVLGAIVGFIVALHMTHDEPIGDLRIDESDPEDGLYLFLELKTMPDNLKTRKQVILNVKAENYISQN